MRQRTAYGKSVMHRLIDLDLTQKWLVEQMNAKAQEKDIRYYIDGEKLSNYLVGKRQSEVTKILIEEILCEAENKNCETTQ